VRRAEYTLIGERSSSTPEQDVSEVDPTRRRSSDAILCDRIRMSLMFDDNLCRICGLLTYSPTGAHPQCEVRAAHREWDAETYLIRRRKKTRRRKQPAPTPPRNAGSQPR
jgi:hypothetical protein